MEDYTKQTLFNVYFDSDEYLLCNTDQLYNTWIRKKFCEINLKVFEKIINMIFQQLSEFKQEIWGSSNSSGTVNDNS